MQKLSLFLVVTFIFLLSYFFNDVFYSPDHSLKTISKAVGAATFYNREIGTSSRYGTVFRLKFNNNMGISSNVIVTNRHVCDVSKLLNTPDSININGVPTRIITYDKNIDICLLEDNGDDSLVRIKLADESPNKLDLVTLIGHPSGNDIVITHGRIVDTDLYPCIDYQDGNRCIKSTSISALAQGGSSGSPLLNEDLELVGILYAVDSNFQNTPFVVPLDLIKEFLNGQYNL